MVLQTPPSYCCLTNELSPWLHLDPLHLQTGLGWTGYIYILTCPHPQSDSNILLNFSLKDWQSLVGRQPRRFYNWWERGRSVILSTLDIPGLRYTNKHKWTGPSTPNSELLRMNLSLSHFYCLKWKAVVRLRHRENWTECLCWVGAVSCEREFTFSLHLHFLSCSASVFT